jgi:pimeloyl-ACP methyl ester carboxylesterase
LISTKRAQWGGQYANLETGELRSRCRGADYDDMVAAQYDLVKNHLGIDHLRLVMGNSMRGMLTWVWGVTHRDFMDALVPMASLPRPDVRAQLDDAPDADRRRPHRSGVGRRELQGAAAQSRDRECLVLDRHSNGERRLATIGHNREAADAFVD